MTRLEELSYILREAKEAADRPDAVGRVLMDMPKASTVEQTHELVRRLGWISEDYRTRRWLFYKAKCLLLRRKEKEEQYQ